MGLAVGTCYRESTIPESTYRVYFVPSGCLSSGVGISLSAGFIEGAIKSVNHPLNSYILYLLVKPVSLIWLVERDDGFGREFAIRLSIPDFARWDSRLGFQLPPFNPALPV
jgi:hypothetical protein